MLKILVFSTVFFVLLPLVSASAFDWQAMESGRWVSVPTHGTPANKVFHGGAAIAPDRAEVFFFGSDTHWPTDLERGESNSVWRLNLETLTWSEDYVQDEKDSYRILPDSQCVTSSGRPWAMHTFDAVVYDPEVDRIVVVSQPTHTRFEPEKRFPMFRGDWFKTLSPSHWEYDPDTKEWTLLLSAAAPNLFARSMIMDGRRNVLIAHDGAKTWHFNREQSKWKALPGQTGETIPGYHLSMVYDSYADAALLLGKNGGSDTLFTYDPHKKSWARAKVKGKTMPANGATLAYDTRNSVMLYLANDYENQYNNPTGKSVTYIYQSKEQSWTRLDIDSPELYGMNYLMQYDPLRNVFLHFEKSPDQPNYPGDRIKVWAFRYR